MTTGRLLLTILVAGVMLLILEILRVLIQKPLARKYSPEDRIVVQFTQPFLVNFVFVVMLPVTVYAGFFPVLPFTSYRSGLFIGLFIFGVGVLPMHIRNFNQYKLPGVIAAFDLFWSLLTLLLVIGSITYTYHY